VGVIDGSSVVSVARSFIAEAVIPDVCRLVPELTSLKRTLLDESRISIITDVPDGVFLVN